MHFRKVLMEKTELIVKFIRSARRDKAEPEISLLPRAHRSDFLLRHMFQLQDLHRIAVQHLARLRESDVPGPSPEKLSAQLIFQKTHLIRKRRLRNMKELCRARDGPPFNNCHEIFQLLDIHDP